LAASASTKKAGAVVDARGVAGGDGAGLVEGGLHLGQGFHGGAGLDVLVGVEHDVALAGLDGDRDDLFLEVAGGDGGGGAALRFAGKFVLLSRVRPCFLARFSAVTPMWPTPKGSVSAQTMASSILVSPMRAPERIAGDMYTPRDMTSTPPPMAKSASPSRMAWAELTMACCAEPHRRLTERRPIPWSCRPGSWRCAHVGVARLGGNHVTDSGEGDGLGVNAGAGDGLLDDETTQIGRFHAGQGTVEGAYRGTRGAQYYDFSLVSHCEELLYL
jgi:hypothetical protein